MRVKIGSDFNAYNEWIDKNGLSRNIGFDVYNITGILIFDLSLKK